MSEFETRMQLIAALVAGGCEIPHCSSCQKAIDGEPADWTLHEDPATGLEFKIFFCQASCAERYYAWLEEQVFADEE